MNNPLELIAEIEYNMYNGKISLQELGILENYYLEEIKKEKDVNFNKRLLARIYNISKRYSSKQLAVTGEKYVLFLNDKCTENTKFGKTKNIAFKDLNTFLSDPEGLKLLVDMLPVPEIAELHVTQSISSTYPVLITTLMAMAERSNKKFRIVGMKDAIALDGRLLADDSGLSSTYAAELNHHFSSQVHSGNINALMPSELQIILASGKCNIGCRFCVSSITDTPKRIMNMETLKHAVDAIPQGIPIKVGLTPFTEPFIIKNYLDMVEYAILKRPEANIGFNTNAVAMHKQRCERIVDMQLKYIFISLNMPTKDSYAWFHGKNFYENVVRNIHTLINIREKKNSKFPIVSVQFLYHKKIQHMLNSALSYWRKHVDNAWIRRISLPGDTPEVRNELRNRIGDDPQKNQIDTIYPCHSVYMALNVDVNGYYSPCCHIGTARSIHKTNPNIHADMVLGHVRDMSFMEVWNSSKLKKIRALQLAQLLPVCKGCLCRQDAESVLFGIQEFVMQSCYGV